MPDPSFDVVSELDMQEVRNAVQQASKEIQTRFDFKGTGTSIELKDEAIEVRSGTDQRLNAAVQVLEEKLVKRKVSLKALDKGKLEDAAGGTYRQEIKLNQGVPTEKAKEMVKLIKGMKLKVQAAIQGDSLRVSGKKKDDLQAVMAALKEKDFGIPLQFTNYR
ncbi:MAG: YajQ family cyclic di-GMP-binding protein [Acidobacteria bacterium]|nr:MAG: YajQ family cyclic di-GMP-binding protein [Acidobacteriota bacterium]